MVELRILYVTVTLTPVLLKMGKIMIYTLLPNTGSHALSILPLNSHLNCFFWQLLPTILRLYGKRFASQPCSCPLSHNLFPVPCYFVALPYMEQDATCTGHSLNEIESLYFPREYMSSALNICPYLMYPSSLKQNVKLHLNCFTIFMALTKQDLLA